MQCKSETVGGVWWYIVVMFEAGANTSQEMSAHDTADTLLTRSHDRNPLQELSQESLLYLSGAETPVVRLVTMTCYNWTLTSEEIIWFPVQRQQFYIRTEDLHHPHRCWSPVLTSLHDTVNCSNRYQVSCYCFSEEFEWTLNIGYKIISFLYSLGFSFTFYDNSSFIVSKI